MHRGAVLVSVLLLAGTACSHGRGSGAGPSPQAQGVRVRVSNHYKLEMDVSATGSGTTQRLGVVAPGLEREFNLPQVFIVGGSLTLSAHPTGYGSVVRSDELRIRPGDVVDFEIATNLIGSQAWVRP